MHCCVNAWTYVHIHNKSVFSYNTKAANYQCLHISLTVFRRNEKVNRIREVNLVHIQYSDGFGWPTNWWVRCTYTICVKVNAPLLTAHLPSPTYSLAVALPLQNTQFLMPKPIPSSNVSLTSIQYLLRHSFTDKDTGQSLSDTIKRYIRKLVAVNY